MRDRLLNLFIGIAFILALAFSGCARHKQSATPRPRAEPITRADSTGHLPVGVVVQPPRTLLDKLTGRTPAPVHYPPGTPVVVKGKKNTLTINQVAGDQSNQNNTAGKNAAAGAGATAGGKADGPVAGAGADLDNVVKAKAPVATSSGSATDNTKQGQRGGAGASGPGASATATTLKPGLPWGRIAAGVVGGGFLIWVVFGGGAATLLALWRKNKPTENQA